MMMVVKPFQLILMKRAVKEKWLACSDHFFRSNITGKGSGRKSQTDVAWYNSVFKGPQLKNVVFSFHVACDYESATCYSFY